MPCPMHVFLGRFFAGKHCANSDELHLFYTLPHGKTEKTKSRTADIKQETATATAGK